jgi:hypothetical protein
MAGRDRWRVTREAAIELRHKRPKPSAGHFVALVAIVAFVAVSQP